MNTSLFFLAFVAAVAADKIPDFVVPGRCPVVDEKSLFDEQIPNHSKMETNSSPSLLASTLTVTHEAQRPDSPMPLGDPHLSVDYEGSWISLCHLDTDYENFSCIYSCTEYNFGYYSDFSSSSPARQAFLTNT
ncbi:crustacyanin subunit C [Penaeus vannamei]|uniref:Crustacyanin subunit C n=1 Tax=Penaeus vannamei TaxID=6689 RepID=A0A3R7MR75_PENVA|nr:crustacyanin subunit C [Penaeus vannamei]